MRDARHQTGQPIADLIKRQPVRERGKDIFETRPVHILHHDPVFTVRVGPHIEQVHEIGMFEIQALRDTAQLNLLLVLNQLERDLFPRVADGVIDLTKPAAVDAAPDREAVNGSRSRLVSELHGVRLRSVCF